MARRVAISLNWHGIYTRPSAVSKIAGIYLVMAGAKGSEGKWSTSTYRLIDIGQSKGDGGNLADHDREECWSKSKPEGTSLLFKIAHIPSEHYDKTDRRIIECCLRAQNRPLACGTECNEGYSREDSVEITNIGSYLPLSPRYTCPVEAASKPKVAA